MDQRLVPDLIIEPKSGAGVTAWKTSGANLHAYLEAEEKSHDGKLRNRLDPITVSQSIPSTKPRLSGGVARLGTSGCYRSAIG